MIAIENIQRIRGEKRISQAEMAEKLGIAQNNYGKIERGITELSVDRLYKIAEILDVTPAKLLNLDVQPEAEKEKRISAHQIEIAAKDQIISDLRKIKEITEEALEDFCDMIEHEIWMNYEKALYTELGIEEEEIVDEDGKGTGGFTFFTTDEQDEIVFHNNIFKNNIVYEYFNKGFYRYSRDGMSVVESFLHHYKSYNPHKAKSKIHLEIINNPLGEIAFLNKRSEEELLLKILECHDRIKDKDRIIKMNDSILKNIIDDIDDSIENVFLEIIQSYLLIEGENFGKIWKYTHGGMTLVPLREYFEQPFFVKAKVNYEYKNLTLLPEEINKLIRSIYESEIKSEYMSLLAGSFIVRLCEHDEILEKSKYLKYFRDFNKSNIEDLE